MGQKSQIELAVFIKLAIVRLRRTDNLPHANHRKERGATKIYTREEVAAVLNCSTDVVTGFIEKKMLHASVFNLRYCIGERSLLKFIRDNPFLFVNK